MARGARTPHRRRLPKGCRDSAAGRRYRRSRSAPRATGGRSAAGAQNGPAELIDHVWGDRRGGGWSQIAGAAAIAGYPSLTVPAGLVSGLPVGITLVGNRNQDGLLLQVARAYERAANPRMPPHLMV